MFDNQFYPTPKQLIDKMLKDINKRSLNSVLEPSAGKGDIVSQFDSKIVDCIEIDANLTHILKGNNYKVIHDDFLTFNTYKRYDLIIMNPPFKYGEKHLLKAIDMQQNGGQIVCILNAETIKNPCTVTRKDLINKLESYNANIEYINNSFSYAEVKTDVEIALIKLDIPKAERESVIINHLKQQETFTQKQSSNSDTNLINGDFIQGIVEQYNFEINAVYNFINEYESIKKYLLTDFKEDAYKSYILKLTTGNDRRYSDIAENELLTEAIKGIRYKYWKAFFQSDKLSNLLTSNLKEEYMGKLVELQDYDFSLYNINQIQLDISKVMIKSLEDTILSLFDEFSHKHYYEESSRNIHYYNGWKTNKSWIINKKVIIALSGFCGYFHNNMDISWSTRDKLQDIEKVFSYLDGGVTENHIDLHEALKSAENQGQSRNINLKYFNITFYKKGTCHITFTNLELLKKFNIFGSMKKGWLPPNYGKSNYNNMNEEEKKVINEFEGKKEYQKVYNNLDYYIFNINKVLMIENKIA